MGAARRPYRPGGEAGGGVLARPDSNPGSPAFGSGSQRAGIVGRNGEGRIGRKHPLPSPGDRFGELVVCRILFKPTGGVLAALVKCSCGAAPHRVSLSNLRRGATTRCPDCSRKQQKRTIKQWFGYESIVPDPEHRRRLCNRISACYNRCHNPNDAGYENYGGRGIAVWEPWREDRALFLAHLVGLDGWDNPALEMDRIDVNKGYEPGNLRFITKAENSRNKRSVKDLQRRIAELEARLRHCQCGTSQSVHGSD